MLLTFDEADKIEILRLVSKISKKSMKKKIEDKINGIIYPKDIDEIYEAIIFQIMNHSYLLLPRSDRTVMYKRILLHGMKYEIEKWEDLGGQIILSLTNFAYQFVRGRNEMTRILKEYGLQIISTEINSDVGISNYKSNYNQKKILIEFNYLYKEVEI